MNVDRLSIRSRPAGLPIMHQNWGKLLFIHWPIAVDALRPLIPSRLEIDTFDERAWIGVVPFTMWGVRLSFAPPVPGLSAFRELNVRTYVHLDGVPGVWFFSLDASNALAVQTARRFFHLPYFKARMRLDQIDNTINYHSTRIHAGAAPAGLHLTWTIGAELPQAEPDSLEFFLTERYCLYSSRRNELYRARIFHEPWPLRKAKLTSYQSTMIEAHGIAGPQVEPLLHYAESLKADIWPLKEV